MSQVCSHGYSISCPDCHKENQNAGRDRIKAGTHAYYVVPWKQAGHYRAQDAWRGKPYQLQGAANRKAEALGRDKHAPDGYVVRFLPKPLTTEVERLERAGTATGRFQSEVPNPSAFPTPEDRVRGVVKWWNDSKGFGFIVAENGRDVWAHYTAIYMDGYKTLHEGQAVTMQVITGPRGPQAAEIRPEGAQ